MLIIFATIMTLTVPTGQLSAESSLIYLGVWRIILGIGVGGDYPMSATVTSDRANLRKRGTMLTYIFSMQGWGSFFGSLATIIVLAIYRHTIEDDGKLSKVDGGVCFWERVMKMYAWSLTDCIAYRAFVYSLENRGRYFPHSGLRNSLPTPHPRRVDPVRGRAEGTFKSRHHQRGHRKTEGGPDRREKATESCCRCRESLPGRRLR